MNYDKQLAMIIESANEIYVRKGLLDIRRIRHEDPSDDDAGIYDLDYLGNILDKNGEASTPVALCLVTTQRPEKSISIVETGSPAFGEISFAALEEVAGYISFADGRGAVLWLNGGHLGVLNGNAVVMAAKRYITNMDRVEAGGPSKTASTRLTWDQFQPVPAAKHETLGLVYDWLKASRPGWAAEYAAPPLVDTDPPVPIPTAPRSEPPLPSYPPASDLPPVPVAPPLSPGQSG